MTIEPEAPEGWEWRNVDVGVFKPALVRMLLPKPPPPADLVTKLRTMADWCETKGTEDEDTLLEAAKVIERVVRYVKNAPDLDTVAHRGVEMFGKRWAEICDVTLRKVKP